MIDEFISHNRHMVKQWQILAAASGSPGVFPSHVLVYLLEGRKDVRRLLERMGITVVYDPSRVRGLVETGPNTVIDSPVKLSVGVVRAVAYACEIACYFGDGEIKPLHLFMGLVRDRSNALQPFFAEQGLSHEKLMLRYTVDIIGRRRRKRVADSSGDFVAGEIDRQIAYKRAMWPELVGPTGGTVGVDDTRGATGHDRDRAGLSPTALQLPEDHWQENIYAGIRDGLVAYMTENNIAFHQQKNHVLSSQICCFNVMFVFRDYPEAARTFLRPLLPGVREITGIEFEDTGFPGITRWLGEPLQGQRGRFRTSADLSVTWLDNRLHRHVTYIEWKYTERTFGVCSGFSSHGNTHRDHCLYERVWTDPQGLCYLSSRQKPWLERRYWEHITGPRSPLRDVDGIAYRGCPFRGPLYQLMRLELLAEYARRSVNDNTLAAETAVISFRDNGRLAIVPPAIRSRAREDLLSLWRSLLVEPRRFRTTTIEAMMKAYDDNPEPALETWRAYVRTRYGL